jgi:hypothetical protein
MKVLGRPTVLPREPRNQFVDGQVDEEVISKYAGPRLPKQLPALLAEMVPEIEKVAGPVITYSNHAIITARSREFAGLFAGPSTG